MPKKEYDWEIGHPPPTIDPHSLVKHKVYKQYIKDYIQILNANPLIPDFKISIIDAFAGGGEYLHPETESSYKGSPCLLIEAVAEGEKQVNQTRQEQNTRNRLEIHPDYYFIEKKKCNIDYLNQYLTLQGYADRFEKDIHLIKGEFSQNLHTLIKKLQEKGRRHRCIFILDQYGYKDVPFHDIRTIFRELPHAEIILTFATDWLIDYMADTEGYNTTLKNIGLPLKVDDLLQYKQETQDWRSCIQYTLHEQIFEQSTAAHYTPFFITSKKAGKSFWLIHLSNHPKARDAMTRLHWKLKNHFAHYGGPGLNMMQGYDPKKEQNEDQIDIFSRDEFAFDKYAEKQTMKALLEQIPAQLSCFSGGHIPYGDFYRLNANQTPATDEQIKNATALLLGAKEISIKTKTGGTRRKGHTIKDDDIIKLPTQKTFVLGNHSDLYSLKKKDKK